MNVFISYASDDRAIAEQVAHSIRSRGHTVFFDRVNLPPGESYEAQIEEGISKASVMVFLISPDSVAPGRFTLTELNLAEKKWESANHNVLPVMLRETEFDTIPSYLKSVTILEPVGNIPAEVSNAVEHMAGTWMRRLKPVAVVSTIVVALVAVGIYLIPPTPDFDVEAIGPQIEERGLFNRPNVYSIDVNALNKGKVSGKVVSVSLDVEPKNGLKIQEDIVSTIMGEQALVASGAAFKRSIMVGTGENSANSKWRVCLHFETIEESCSPFVKWSAPKKNPYDDHFPISASYLDKAQAIVWDGGNYLIAASSPNRIIRVNERGDIVTESAVNGTPTAITKGPLGLYLATSSPDKVLRLNPGTLKPENEIEVKLSTKLKGTFGDPVSNTPVNIAQDGQYVWIITRGGASGNGLAYFDANLSRIQTPPYYEDISFDLAGMSLRSGNGAVWSVESDTTPASIRRMTADVLTEFAGHDYDIASCATDIFLLPWQLLVPNCDGDVVELPVPGTQLQSGKKVGRIQGYQNNMNAWPVVRFAQTQDKRNVAGVTITHNPADSSSRWNSMVLSSLDDNGAAKIRFDASKASIVDMAVGTESALIILESDSGERQLVAPKLYN